MNIVTKLHNGSSQQHEREFLRKHWIARSSRKTADTRKLQWLVSAYDICTLAQFHSGLSCWGISTPRTCRSVLTVSGISLRSNSVSAAVTPTVNRMVMQQYIAYRMVCVVQFVRNKMSVCRCSFSSAYKRAILLVDRSCVCNGRCIIYKIGKSPINSPVFR